MKAPSIHFISVLLFVFFVSSCAYQPKQETIQNVKIGISLGRSDGRWIKDMNYLKESLRAKGATVIVFSANNDQRIQLADINSLVREEVDVMIIAPTDAGNLAEKIEKVRKKGIKVIAYDRMIMNCDLDFYVSFDNLKVGEMQAEYLSALVPKGNYMMLGGAPTDPNSKLLRLGQMNVLQPLITRGDIKVVHDTFVENWDENQAYEVVLNYLNGDNPELDVIVSSSDNLSNGAVKALQEKGLEGKVMISGQDAQEMACKRILEGSQIMTVYKFIESLANTASNVAITLAKNEQLPNSQLTVNNGKMMVPAILLPSMISVNKENLRMTVIADGYMDESIVYSKVQ
jgi:D-xylose transport system substrate-binding protein